MMYGQKKHQVI